MGYYVGNAMLASLVAGIFLPPLLLLMWVQRRVSPTSRRAAHTLRDAARRVVDEASHGGSSRT
jgi:hypothetical protein